MYFSKYLCSKYLSILASSRVESYARTYVRTQKEVVENNVDLSRLDDEGRKYYRLFLWWCLTRGEKHLAATRAGVHPIKVAYIRYVKTVHPVCSVYICNVGTEQEVHTHVHIYAC